ncbi:MAG: DUF2815 family protein [Patescibacteria group bacterium]|nr:DUF2815 family protein [Patescibacteria group bacterium]
MVEQVKSIGALHLQRVRFSYFYGFEPYTARPTPQNPTPKPQFCVHGLMAPTHPDVVNTAKVIEAVGQAKWGAQWPAIREALKGQDRLCLHRGDITKAGQPEYAGLVFISASNPKRFTIVDGDRSPLTEKDGRPYSGCYGNLIVDIWAQDNQFGKRINATVTGAQFVAHGEAFGAMSRAAAPDEFPDIGGAADAPAPAAAADPLAGLI